MDCIYCQNECYKKGKRNGIQRYSCKVCGKTQQEQYKKFRISESKYEWVVKLHNEGCSMGSISRLLQITKSSVQRLLLKQIQPTQ